MKIHINLLMRTLNFFSEIFLFNAIRTDLKSLTLNRGLLIHASPLSYST